MFSISKYNLLVGRSYTKLSKELDHPRKGLVNIQTTDDNECFKWCLVRNLNPANRNPASITKADKDFAKRHDFKDLDFHKTEKKNSIRISIFGYENKVKYPIYISKKFREDKQVDLLLISEVEKKHYVKHKITIHDLCGF